MILPTRTPQAWKRTGWWPGALAVMFGESTETGARMTSVGDAAGKPLRRRRGAGRGADPAAEELADSITLIRGMVWRTDSGEQIPAIAMRPTGRSQGAHRAVDRQSGKSVLLDEAGRPNAVVKTLTSAGISVVSIDPFLRAVNRGKPPEGKSGASRSIPSTRSTPAYTFGYNAPLLAHRVRDIVATAQALRMQEGFRETRGRPLREKRDCGRLPRMPPRPARSTGSGPTSTAFRSTPSRRQTPRRCCREPRSTAASAVWSAWSPHAGGPHRLAGKDAERARAIVTAAAGRSMIEGEPAGDRRGRQTAGSDQAQSSDGAILRLRGVRREKAPGLREQREAGQALPFAQP